ncbi:MED28 [Acanthosepion pharaonis]|uniref:Mediator of RNA polymerase II transcription subunit 28 n=1 Tax=Acanthosepion pharaonis TaxID=158019 RepID=A0A812AS51_ACAPH|nr:MED28 [Sepia pharaonis]
MATPSSERMATEEPSLVDDLEAAFQNCLSLLTSQEHFNVTDSEETKAGIEHALQRFLEVSRQIEAFFLRKRMILSILKPEQVIKEEFSDLEQELMRKESLLQKHQHRLQQWQNLLCNLQSGPQQPPPPPQPGSGASQAPQGSGQPPAGGGVGGGPMSMHGMQPNLPGYPQVQPSQTQQGMPPASQSLVMPPPQTPQVYPQTPLAYLEQTMTNIGIP